jgi:hypothetical protein
MTDGLARCAVLFNGARLRNALDHAGISVIEVRRWGWDQPHPVEVSVLGEHAADVPRAVVAADT